MSRPRLLFVVESGCDVRIVEGLAERFDLEVVARRIVGGREISQAPSVPVQVTVGPSSRVGFARMVLSRLRESARRPDFVLVQGYAFAALAANVAARWTGVPTAMLVCSPVEAYYECRRVHAEPGMPFRRHELLALGLLARLNARLGSRYLVLSEHLADVVRGHGARHVDVVPIYGVDLSLFQPSSETRDEARAALQLPLDGALLFFSSRVAPEKDAETLLRTLRRLREEGRDVRLLHRSGRWKQFAADAERFGVADIVFAADALRPGADLARAYRACDLCVQASRAEGLGFSVLEALACEVPVVAAAVGGLRETIRDGETGWSYPVGDDVALARAIREALDAPEEARRRALAGRQMVERRYARELVFARLEEIVRSATRTSRRDIAAPVDGATEAYDRPR
jgi:glycosyltransferase involved in cell wall biosynthesis